MMEGKFILVIRHDYCGLVGLFVVINYVASYQQVIYVVDYEALFEEDQHVVDTKWCCCCCCYKKSNIVERESDHIGNCAM